MSDRREIDAARLEELLGDRATVGLSSEEQRELVELLARAGETGEPSSDASELAAAALDVAFSPTQHPELPAALRAKLVARGEAFSAERKATQKRGEMRAIGGEAPRGNRSVAWWVAAAAVVLALIGWWPKLAGILNGDVADRRAELLARENTLRVDAKGTELAKDAVGDVVWSNAAQQGFLRVTGLPANDPSVQQYQLWIFDEAQEHPIDGGVFDVSGGELLMPINAKLRVARPKLFAVTLEKPGGVVVSDQKRIALVAAL